MNSTKIITICSSASFYQTVMDLEEDLRKMGFKVLVPLVAKKMKIAGDFGVEKYKTWDRDPKAFKRKTYLMNEHFKKVARGDAILVVNLEKKGVEGYVGGNVLLEMGLAYFLKKKIFLLNPVSRESNLYEEVIGLKPVILDGDLGKIKRLI